MTDEELYYRGYLPRWLAKYRRSGSLQRPLTPEEISIITDSILRYEARAREQPHRKPEGIIAGIKRRLRI